MSKVKIGLIFGGVVVLLSTSTFVVIRVLSKDKESQGDEHAASEEMGPYPAEEAEEDSEEPVDEVVDEEPEEDSELEPEEDNTLSTSATADKCLLYPVGKDTPLPSGFEPSSSSLVIVSDSYKVRSDAAAALTDMLDTASSKGYTFSIRSAYRSCATQAATFENWVQYEMEKGYSRSEAEARAAEYSARPGTSEHQIGSTTDIVLPRLGNEFTQDMWDTPEVDWLKKNAHKYGFVISYPEGKQSITGYRPEPWHVRWVGVNHATAVYNKNYLNANNNVTLESYLKDLFD